MITKPIIFTNLLAKLTVFHKNYQPFLKEAAEKLDIEFITSLNLVQNLEDCLEVFDGSCVDYYHERDNVTIAVAGRHKTLQSFLLEMLIAPKLIVANHWAEYRSYCLDQIFRQCSAAWSLWTTVKRIIDTNGDIATFWSFSYRLWSQDERLFTILFKYSQSSSNLFHLPS